MPNICRVSINGDVVSANPGDLLLDVALINGIELPHDCRSGHCGTCQVRIVAGRCLSAATNNPNIVHACQARVLSDLEVVAEKVPETVEMSGSIVDLIDIAPDVFEVCIKSKKPIDYIPGQYLSIAFRGFPARHYSPTVPLDWPNNPDLIRFHVRRLRSGRVSSALGRKIKIGHQVQMTGPFGAAYFRPNNPGRLVLISSGTGFAPIWAIAEAAIKEKPKRDLVLIAGARNLESLYMIPALCRLALFPYVTIIPTVQTGQSITSAVRHGQPTDYLPQLSTSDLVYAAGGPSLVQTVAKIAGVSGATYFADPFLPAAVRNYDKTFFSRIAKWLPLAAENPAQLPATSH